MRFGSRIAEEAYERTWEEAAGEPSDGEIELVDVFDQRIEGLWPDDCRWMYLSGLLRDAVSALEVYLEQARDEALGRTMPAERSPRWPLVLRFYSALGVEAAPPPVEQIRQLHHFLTHRRAELRSEQQREQFAADHLAGDYPPIVMRLEPEGVEDALRTLGQTVREVDAVMWRDVWGGVPLPAGTPSD